MELSTLPGMATAPDIEAPQSPQNLASERFGRPQAAHVTASGVPHSVQNFRPASLAVPQAAQVTGRGCSFADGEYRCRILRGQRDRGGRYRMGPTAL